MQRFGVSILSTRTLCHVSGACCLCSALPCACSNSGTIDFEELFHAMDDERTPFTDFVFTLTSTWDRETQCLSLVTVFHLSVRS